MKTARWYLSVSSSVPRLSTHFADHLQNATYRLANRALRFEFLHHLRQKYSLDCDDERAL